MADYEAKRLGPSWAQAGLVTAGLVTIGVLTYTGLKTQEPVVKAPTYNVNLNLHDSNNNNIDVDVHFHDGKPIYCNTCPEDTVSWYDGLKSICDKLFEPGKIIQTPNPLEKEVERSAPKKKTNESAAPRTSQPDATTESAPKKEATPDYTTTTFDLSNYTCR